MLDRPERSAAEGLRSGAVRPSAPEPTPVSSPASVAGLLALQRAAGNRATRRLVPAAPGVVQRLLRFDPNVLGETGAAGEVKALFGQSIYTKIKEALAEYRSTHKAREGLVLLRTLLGLIVKWMDANKSSKSAGNAERAWKLGKLGEAIHLEMPSAQREAAYMRDVEKPEKFKYMSMTGPVAVSSAKKVAEGTGPPEQIELMKKYDLTDADMAAIKIYTVDDYKYINPALAGNQSWLAKQIPKVLGLDKPDVSAEGLKQATAEGRRHGEMAHEAVKKLPVWKGDRRSPLGHTFRGLRLTPEEFKQQYVDTNQFRNDAFQSTSLAQEKAEEFAKKPAEDDGKVGIVITMTVTNGRDVAEFSMVGGEKEILLMPGATMTFGKPKEREGRPDDDKIYDVTMQQVA